MPRTAEMKPVLRRKGRSKPWCVTQAASLSPTGKRRDRWFASREAANTWIKAEAKRLRSYSDKAAEFTDEEKMQAAQAFPICREHGFSLLDAVREKADRVHQSRQSVTFDVLKDALLEQLKREKKSTQHIDNARYVGKKLATVFNGSLVSEVGTQKIQNWLDDLSTRVSPATLKQHRRYTNLILEFGRRRGHLATNPVADVRLSYRDEKEVTTLKPEQVAKLLKEADVSIRPYIAVCAFAGLRPAEAQRLAEEPARITATDIYVSAKSAKTRKHRHVPLTDQVRAWLAVAPLSYSRTLFRKAVKDAGLEPWPQDCLRHSYGTYWLALHKNESELALAMGNSPDVIHKHYRKPTSEAEARAYFKIMPTEYL